MRPTTRLFSQQNYVNNVDSTLVCVCSWFLWVTWTKPLDCDVKKSHGRNARFWLVETKFAALWLVTDPCSHYDYCEISPLYINFWKIKSFYFFLKFLNLVLFSLRTTKGAAKAEISALARSYTSSSESLPFHIPEAWKRYPFRAEPPRIGHHREFLPPPFQFRAHLLPAHVGL